MSDEPSQSPFTPHLEITHTRPLSSLLKDIVEATVLKDYLVRLRFEDGVVGELDLSAIMTFEGVFAPLKNLDRFRELGVHPDLGTIYWPNGADLDPAVLYARVTGTPIPPYELNAGRH